MIRVKQSKTADSAADPAQRYRFGDAPVSSGLPYAIGMAMTSIALYLRSMVKSSSALTVTADESTAAPTDEKSVGLKIEPDTIVAQAAKETPAVEQPKAADKAATDFVPAFKFSNGDNVVSLFAAQGRAGSHFGTRFHAPNSKAVNPEKVAPNFWDSTSFTPGSGATTGSADGEPATQSGPQPNAKPVLPAPNHAPVRQRSVYLTDLFGTGAVLITLASLLDHVSDADADILTVQGLTASSGTLVRTGEGYLYTPDPAYAGVVQFAYRVSDGIAEVAQMAHFSILPNAVTGGAGDDVLTGTAGVDKIDGGTGDDVIDAGAGNDVIVGGAGNDRIDGGAGDDQIFGGNGADILFGGAGQDWISGGAGDDTVFGGAGDDVLYGDAGNDAVYGGADRDILFGGDGDDLLDGGAAADLIDGGAGADWLTDGDGADIVYGGAGSDTIHAASDGSDDQFHGDDSGSGATDFDTLDYTAMTQHIHIDLQAGAVDGVQSGHDTFDGIEMIIAGSGDDQIDGSSGDDIVQDGAGSDRVSLGAGDDTVVVSADAEADHFDGGEGRDTLDLSLDTHGMTVNLQAGTVDDGDGTVDVFDNFEIVIGTRGDDVFLVGSNYLVLSGGGGDDHYKFGSFEDVYESAALICDFSVGDVIETRRFYFFESDDKDHDGAFQLSLGEAVDGLDMSAVAFSYGTQDDEEITRLDVVEDDQYSTVITFHGHHTFTMTYAH